MRASGATLGDLAAVIAEIEVLAGQGDDGGSYDAAPRGLALLVAIALSIPGCARSVLIHKDDLTYRRAIDHVKRTRQLVAESLAPEDDQAIFLQAEGLFRYRFAPPGRSVGSYAAQITSAVLLAGHAPSRRSCGRRAASLGPASSSWIRSSSRPAGHRASRPAAHRGMCSFP